MTEPPKQNPKQNPKQEEKKKYYLGFIVKEELQGFFDRLKDALKNGQKSGDKKSLEIEIRGSKEDPKGVAIEHFTFDKTKFSEFFDPEAEHTKKALVLFTLNLEVKKPKDVETIKTSFEMLKPMLYGIPGVKGKEGKYEFHFRNNGNKVAFDVISTEGKIIQPLLDLGIDLAEYHNFRFELKTGADLGKIYDQGQNPSDELLSEILNLLIYVKSSGENIKYLSTALLTAFKDVKIEGDAKKQKKLEKFLGILNLVNVFIGAKVKLEYDANTLKSEGEKEVEKLQGGTEGFKKQLSGYHAMATGMGQNAIKPAVEEMGFGTALKALNLDCISIAYGVPKYQNGHALILKLPGLTHVLEELLK